ncbi:MAG: hypothetical protein RBU37_20185, partial [Myxococcota bacterium]|nr:hypothetical protein [Myxococcota bacterium]
MTIRLRPRAWPFCALAICALLAVACRSEPSSAPAADAAQGPASPKRQHQLPLNAAGWGAGLLILSLDEESLPAELAADWALLRALRSRLCGEAVPGDIYLPRPELLDPQHNCSAWATLLLATPSAKELGPEYAATPEEVQALERLSLRLPVAQRSKLAELAERVDAEGVADALVALEQRLELGAGNAPKTSAPRVQVYVAQGQGTMSEAHAFGPLLLWLLPESAKADANTIEPLWQAAFRATLSLLPASRRAELSNQLLSRFGTVAPQFLHAWAASAWTALSATGDDAQAQEMLQAWRTEDLRLAQRVKQSIEAYEKSNATPARALLRDALAYASSNVFESISAEERPRWLYTADRLEEFYAFSHLNRDLPRWVLLDLSSIDEEKREWLGREVPLTKSLASAMTQEVGETGQAPNQQKVGETGQAPNQQKVGETGQAPNQQKVGETG